MSAWPLPEGSLNKSRNRKEDKMKKKKKGKKLIALVIAAALCTGLMPLQSVMAESEPVSSIEGEVSAGETEAETAVLSEDEGSGDTSQSAEEDSVSVTLSAQDADAVEEEAATLSDDGNSEEVIDSGTCGDNLTWVLTGDGTLTISGEGEMDNYSSRSTAPWYDERSTISRVTIRNGATSIGDVAFAECGILTEITIPDSITYIGFGAFTNCSSLTEVIIPDGVTSISYDTFYGCSSLTKVTLPEGLTYIGWYSFGYCTNLTEITIPDSVTSIADYAFVTCSSLEKMMIPEGVTSIGMSVFYGCSSLTAITIPDSVTSIADYAFQECDSLTDVYYSGSEEDWNAITIGSYNTDLTNATIHYNSTGPYLGTITLDGPFSGIAGEEIIISASLADSELVPVDSDVTWSITSASGDGTDFQATWGDTSILTVSKGEYIISCPVTVDTAGIYDVTITVSNGLSATESLVVRESGLYLYGNDALCKGSVAAISLIGIDEDIDENEIVWESSDTSIIDVTGTGTGQIIELKKAGTVTITATCPNGQVESLTIEIEPKLVRSVSKINSVSDDGTVESEVTLYYVELEDDETFDLENFLSEIVVEVSDTISPATAAVSSSYYEISEDETYAEIKVNVTYTLGDEGTIGFTAFTNGGQEAKASVATESLSDIFDFDVSYAEYDGGDDDVIKYIVTTELSEPTGSISWEGNIWIRLITNDGGIAEQSADGIGAGDTLTFSWFVDIEKSAYPDGGSEEIGCVVGFGDVPLKDQMFSIAVDASNGKSNVLDFDTDVWNFHNPTDDNYHINAITDDDKNALLTGLSSSEYAAILDSLKTNGNGGHCFGMALTTILSKMNIFDITDFSDADCLRDAKKTDRIMSILCYYQCLQKLNSFTSAEQQFRLLEYNVSADGSSYSKKSEEEYRQGVAEQLSILADATAEVENGGTPVLFGFGGVDSSGDEWGHAIVAYGVESGSWTYYGTTYTKRIKTYDSNTTDSSGHLVEDEESYLYFNEGTDEWIIPNYYNTYGAVSTNEDAYLALVSNDLSLLNTQNYDASLYNYIAELSVQNETAMRLANSNNKYTIPGDTDLATYSDAEILDSDESGVSTLHVILPDENDDYTMATLSGEAEELDFYISDEDLFMSVEADAATGSAFSIQRVFSLLGNEGSYEIKIADDDLDGEEFNTYVVTGENTGDMTVELTADGVLVSGDELTEITVAGGDREADTEVVFSTEKDSALVVPDNDNTELIVLTDQDNDGTYETVIGSSDESSNGETGSITTPEADNGTVTADVSDAMEGDTVTITVTPDEGYELDGLVVTDPEGNLIEVTDNGDGTYSFVMPDGDVTIDASFRQVPEDASGEGSPEAGENSGTDDGTGETAGSSTGGDSSSGGTSGNGNTSAGGSDSSGSTAQASSQDSSSSGSAVETGDTSYILFWILLLAAGGAGTGITSVICLRRRKQHC